MPLVTFTVTRDASYLNYIDFNSQTGSQSFTMGPDAGTVQLDLPEGATYTLSGRSTGSDGNQSLPVLWRRDSPIQVGLEDGGDNDYNDLQVSVNVGSFSLSGTDVFYEASTVSILSFTVNTNTIQLGESVTFTWTSTGGTRANINVAPVNPNFGTFTVTPISTAVNGSWVLRVENDFGRYDTAVVYITVTSPAPTIDSFSASPTSIILGSSSTSSTLTWTTTNATSVTISGISGTLNPDGSTIVNPTATTTYTLTATGPGGTVTSNPVTVTVYTPPTVSLSGPVSLNYNANGNLTYSSTNATSLTLNTIYTYIDGSSASQPSRSITPPSGSIPTQITYNTLGPTSVTYSLVAIGGGGSSATSNTVVIPINIDQTPDAIIIPDTGPVAKAADPVYGPAAVDTYLTITGVDIPIEIKANKPIKVDINRQNNYRDVRSI